MKMSELLGMYEFTRIYIDYLHRGASCLRGEDLRAVVAPDLFGCTLDAVVLGDADIFGDVLGGVDALADDGRVFVAEACASLVAKNGCFRASFAVSRWSGSQVRHLDRKSRSSGSVQ